MAVHCFPAPPGAQLKLLDALFTWTSILFVLRTQTARLKRIRLREFAFTNTLNYSIGLPLVLSLASLPGGYTLDGRKSEVRNREP